MRTNKFCISDIVGNAFTERQDDPGFDPILVCELKMLKSRKSELK